MEEVKEVEKMKTKEEGTKKKDVGTTSSRTAEKKPTTKKATTAVKKTAKKTSTSTKTATKKTSTSKEDVEANIASPQEKKPTTKKTTTTAKTTAKKATAKTTTKNTVEKKKDEGATISHPIEKKSETKKATTAPKKTSTSKDDVGASVTRPQEKKPEIKNEQQNIQETTTVLEKEQTNKENVGASIARPQEKSQNDVKQDNFAPVNKTKSHKSAKIIAIIASVLVICAIIFSTVFAIINRSSDKIIAGVTISGTDVGGLTKEEAKNKINEIYANQLKKNIVLKHNDFETNITPEQIEMKFNIEETVNMAYNTGRTGKLLKDNYAILGTKLFKTNITPSYTYNEEALINFIASTEGNLPDLVKQSGYSIEGSNLIIDKGLKGVGLEDKYLKEQIVKECNTLNENAIIEISTIQKEPEAIDLQKIHNEIYKEAKDAYYTKDPFAVYPHVNGVDFAVSMEEAQNLLNSSEEQTVTIPLKITTPSVTTNQIGTEAFPNLLATFSTTFSTSNVNRSTNIRLAASKINGVVLMPGEEFSYNKVVGKRTIAAGFKTAGVYVNGTVSTDVGGGICQVSSTLYNTVLRANLEIIKRSNHYFATGYVPLSTDATVSWGGPEFIFKNTRKYPVKIVAGVNGGKITVSMYGCKEEVEYEVIIQSQTLQTIPMKTERRINPSLPKGTTKTVQKGHGGYRSRAYRILKLNGKEVSRQLLSTDSYAQLSTIIEQNP